MIFITLQRYDVFCSLTIPFVWHFAYQTFGISYLIECLRQVGNNIVDMLSTDTQADGGRTEHAEQTQY